MPNLAVGLIDLGGTSVFSSEYLIATKKIGNFDVSLGMGWGLLGKKAHISNPLSIFSDSFDARQGSMSGRGGQFEYDDWFKGDAAFFGGFTYYTPVRNLSLEVEYNSNDFKSEMNGVALDVDSPLNFALNYRLAVSERGKLDIALGYARGNTFYTNFTVHNNLNFSGTPNYRLGPEIIKTNTSESYNNDGK